MGVYSGMPVKMDEIEEDMATFNGGAKKYKGKKFTSKKTRSKKTKTKKTKTKKTKTKKTKGKAGAWILHVKSFAKARGLNFPQALKHSDCKKTYKK